MIRHTLHFQEIKQTKKKSKKKKHWNLDSYLDIYQETEIYILGKLAVTQLN